MTDSQADQPVAIPDAAQAMSGRRRMLQGVKIAAAGLLGVLLLGAAGLFWYLNTLDFNTYKPLIQDAVLKASGRALLIDGEMRLSVSLHPSLRVEGVHLANPPGFGRANTMDVARMDVEIRLLPLLSGELLIENIELIDPDILLERLADGRDNWSLAGEMAGAGVSSAAEAGAGSRVILPRVHRLMISNARLGYRDAADGRSQSLDIPELEMWEGEDAANARLNVRVRGEFEKVPLKLQGSISSLHALLANQPLDVSLHASVPGVELKLGGSVARPHEAGGMSLQIDANSPGIGSLAKLFKLPPLLGLAIHVKTTLKDDADGFLLQGLQASLGESDVAGDAHIAMPHGRMRLDATLASNHISLIGLLPEQKTAVAPASSKPGSTGGRQPVRVLSAEPVDLALLRRMDAVIAWDVKQFAMSDLQLADVQIRLRLAGGKLDISPFNATLAGGQLRTSVALHAGKSPAVLGLGLHARGIMADQLLAMRAGSQAEGLMKGGSMDVDLTLDGHGVSVAELLAGSKGRLKLRMGEGKVKSTALNMVGGDILMTLADKLNPFSEKKDSMDLQCGVVHFRIENGMMLSEKGIAFETARMNILSQGSISLRDESIDLSFGTEPRDGIGMNLSNMVNVVKLGGTLAEPGIVVDAGKTGMAAARTAGAMMTGGLSLLGEGLFNRATADSTPCRTALEMK